MAKENPAPPGRGANRAVSEINQHDFNSRPFPKKQARQRHVERLHLLGARVVGELLDEIGRHHDITADIDLRLARYAALDPHLLAVLGADRFPASPMRVVGGAR